MRRRAAWAPVLWLALFGVLAAAAVAAGQSSDVVASQPHLGETASYEGFERVTAPDGTVVANRSLDHTRTWTAEEVPMPDGSARQLPTLSHEYPLPELGEADGGAAIPEPPLPAADDVAGLLEEDDPRVVTGLIAFDVRFTEVPARPQGFSLATVDEHTKGDFWRVFRMHVVTDGFCARAPTGAIVSMGAEEAREAAERCLREVPWGDARSVTLSLEPDEHPRWGPTWLLEAQVDYEGPDGPTQLEFHLRTSPRIALPLEQTLTWTQPGPKSSHEVTRHVEISAHETGDGALPDAELPAPPMASTIRWTPQGPQEDWDPGLSYSEARAAADRDPQLRQYQEDNPDANLNLAVHLRRHADDRSTSATSSANLANCRNPILPRTSPTAGVEEAGWMFFWSGERRDAAALVDEPRPPKAAQTVDPPERTQAATFDSPERLPGLELPRQAPSPSDMLDHLEVVDELGARGAAYAGVVATGPSGSTSAEVDGLTGIMGRQHCEMNPATGRYSYHDQGLAFQQGAASAVYTLRVEAIQRQGQAISSLEAPPGAGDDGSGLGGAAWTGLAVATGALGWVGTRGLSSLYSRLGREDLLEDETRRLIHEHVHERPGVSLADIASGHDKHRSTLAYHLERLEEMGFVETRTTPSGLVAFPPKSPLVDDAETLAKGQAIELVETVIDDPGAHLTAYADELGVAKSYVSRLARELEEAGFLDRTREGRRLLLEPGPRARQLSPETDG